MRGTTTIFALGAAALVAWPALALGEPDADFAACRAFPAGLSAANLVLADFDGDGRLDAALLDPESRQIRVLLGDDVAPFSESRISTVIVDVAALAAADLDADGDADLAAARPLRPGFVDVLANDGTGVFTRLGSTDAGAFPRRLFIADVDGDGSPDVVASNATPNFQVLRGNGAGGFLSSFPFGVGRTPIAFAVADFDGDGLDDVAAATVGDQGIVVRRAIGGGLYAPPVALVPVGRPVDLAAADLDGDGDVDLALALDGASQPASLVTYENDGAGGFTPAWSEGGITRTSRLLAGDLDGDGLDELLVRRNDLRSVLVLRGDGALGFSSRATRLAMGRATAWTLADVDRDGAPDLVSSVDEAIPGTSHLSVAPNDGSGGFPAALVVPASPVAVDFVARDFDRDGIVDFASVNAQSPSVVTVVLGDGKGGARAIATFEVPRTLSPRALAAGDLDADGFQDIVVTGVGGAWILVGDGAGRFSPRSLRPPFSPASPVILDFDGNGHPDVASSNDSSVFLAIADGVGGFIPAVNLGLGREAVAKDIDRDGLPDLVLAASAQTTVCFGDASGRCVRTVSFPAIRGGVSDVGIAVADLDGDGLADLARLIANVAAPSQLEVRFGAAGNGFEPPLTFPVAPGDRGLRAVRLDAGGGKALLLHERSGRVSFYRFDAERRLEKAAADVSAGMVLEAVDVADVDADGRRDVVYLYQYADAIGGRTSIAALLGREPR